MEVRDPIHGNIEVDAGEKEILDSPFFQRLRNIKQMGFADLAFPGATHNRYAHSIGTMELAGRAYDSIFRGHHFERPGTWQRFRRLARLGALLHDVGHAPFSHVCEFAMPPISALGIPCYQGQRDRRATHEDYTVKILTDSPLAQIIARIGDGFGPLHVAALVDASLVVEGDLFIDGGIDYRPVLGQLISSELDVDRMDYLRRDSHNSGVGYGQYDADWILTNLTMHIDRSKAYLALDPRALYAFDDFLIARYHMFLMVYFHHKSVIYEEMLRRHFEACPGAYRIPSDLDAYVDVDDYHLYSYLRGSDDAWARRIVARQPYKLLLESHERVGAPLNAMADRIEAAEIPLIRSSSRGDLSKYTKPGAKRRRGQTIWVRRKDPTGSAYLFQEVRPLEDCTDLFKRYEAERQIQRIYVRREDHARARQLLELDGPATSSARGT